jgi:hypothetical protein
MIAVQTLWTQPYKKKHPEDVKKLFLLQALSSISISNFYETHLVTDSYGAKIVAEMGLPYHTVSTDLDEIEGFPESFWAYPKFLTYKKYIEIDKFIHFDNDVVINRNFKFDCCIVQNNEKTSHPYLMDIQKYELDVRCKKLDIKLPISLDELNDIYNVGIVGFLDKIMLQHYINFNLEFIGDNFDKLKDCDDHTMRLFFIYLEQMILNKITGKDCLKTVFNENYDESHEYQSVEQTKLRYQFKTEYGYNSEEIDDVFPHNLFRLSDIKYCHLFSDIKLNDKIVDHIDFYLKHMYPERYKIIKQTIKFL